MRTRITELLGIDHPIIMSGMQGAGRATLVAAVADSGCAAFLSALTQPTPEALSAEIARTRELTDRPFGVNLTILPTITPPPYAEYRQVVVEAGIPWVELAGSNPEPHLPDLRAAGITVVHKATTIRHALKAQNVGVDAIAIDSFEAAGHIGDDDVPGLILIPAAHDALEAPLVASGGIADGRGLVAALALGADGVNMGTRFLATAESPIHETIKQSLVRRSERDSQLILRTLGNTSRVARNAVSEQVAAVERAGGASFEDVRELVAGSRGRQVYANGDEDFGIWTASGASGLIKDVPTARTLVERIVAEATGIISDRLAKLVD